MFNLRKASSGSPTSTESASTSSSSGCAVNNSSPSEMNSLERVMMFPVVETIWSHGQGAYGKIKGSNAVLTWALGTVESTVQAAAATASPLIHTMDGPMHVVDHLVWKALDRLETSVPAIIQAPKDAYNHTKAALQDRKDAVAKVIQDKALVVCEKTTEGARTLKELSWNKANEVLATRYGNLAVQGIDSSSALAQRMLDYYFPADETELKEQEKPVISADEDGVLHSVQTVGVVGKKMIRRVSRAVIDHLPSRDKVHLLEPLGSLVSMLQRTKYVNYVSNKIDALRASSQTVRQDGSAQVNV